MFCAASAGHNARGVRTFLILLIVAAFLLRLGAVVALRDMRQGPKLSLGSDGVEYDKLAARMVEGQGYNLRAGQPTSFRAPGFPLFLAGLRLIFKQDYRPQYVAFCLLGALACGLTYLLARELLTEGAARVAAVLLVFYFPHVYFSTAFFSEVLFVPLVALALWQFLVYLRTGSLASVAAAALALGWAALTRPVAMLIPPVLIGVLVWSRRKSIRSAVAPVALLVCGFALVVLPWTARNYRVHGKMVWIATNGGSTFYGANNDWVIATVSHYGEWTSTITQPGAAEDLAKDEVDRDRSQWRRGEMWLGSHIRWVPLMLAAKYVRLWLPDISSPNRAFVLLNVVFTTPFLVLILLGQFRMTRGAEFWTPGWLALHGTGLATVAMALLTWGSSRFRDANAPLLMVYAAVAVSWLVPSACRLLGRDSRPPDA
jgi:4-amino-4-deoxy-L-arabinose transferase-like glycosyltransferase